MELINNYQVPEGYKKTEVGVIPVDWDAPDLEEMTRLIIDGTHHTPRYTDYGIPFLRVTDLQSTDIDLGRLKFISPEEHQVLKQRCNPESGDLLLSKNGTIGLTKVVDWEWEFSIFVSLALIKVKKEKLDVYYLDQFFKSNFLYDQLKKRSKQGTVTNLHLEEIRELIVPVPPSFKEQKAIAQTLSDVDTLIAALDKLIAKKRNIKTATMQQLLTGKTRLPGFGEGKGYKKTEVGVIPEDWDVVTLGNIGQSLIGLTYKPENIRNYGTLVLRSSNIKDNNLIYNDNVYIDDKLPLPSRVIVEEGDILVCVRNGSRQLIGKCALIDSIAAGSAFGAFMSVFRTKVYGFVFYQFQSDGIKKQINEIMGATINQITNKDMNAFQVPVPPSEQEQQAIAQVLFDIDIEITALEKRRAKTQAIKQGMMQELLTGRTRLINN